MTAWSTTPKKTMVSMLVKPACTEKGTPELGGEAELNEHPVSEHLEHLPDADQRERHAVEEEESSHGVDVQIAEPQRSTQERVEEELHQHGGGEGSIQAG